MAIGLDSLFQLQNMDPIYRDALMSQMGLAKSSQQGMDQLMSQLAQEALGAQERAAASQGDYEALAKQPPPMEGPGEVTRSLFGNIASAVSGQPQFAQQAQAANARDLGSLMEARKERLAVLHDQVTQRAQLAQQLGNLKLSTSLHQQAGQLERALGNIDKLQQSQVELGQQKQLEGVKHGYEMELQKLKNEGGLAEALTRANAATTNVTPENLMNMNKVIETPFGKFLDVSGYTGKLKMAMEQAAAQIPNEKGGQGLPALDAAGKTKLQNLTTAYQNMLNMLNATQDILPQKGGLGKLLAAGPITVSSIFQLGQKGEERASWQRWGSEAIQLLSALAGGPGSNLRINQQEIATIRKALPTLYDTVPTAVRKINGIMQMIEARAKPLITNDWTPEDIKYTFRWNPKREMIEKVATEPQERNLLLKPIMVGADSTSGPMIYDWEKGWVRQ